MLDLWATKEVKPLFNGEMHLTRFADDFVIGFQYWTDAKRFEVVVPKRFSKFGLVLHPEKTKLLEFGKYARERRKGKRPETFQFLGFTYYCSLTRNGKFTVKLKTASKRLRRSLSRIEAWCKTHRHLPIRRQSQLLGPMMVGHYQYYGRRSNIQSLRKFYRTVLRRWYKWLCCRGSGYLTWRKFEKIASHHPLPMPRITEQPKVTQYSFSLWVYLRNRVREICKHGSVGAWGEWFSLAIRSTHSEQGAETSAILFSIVETCKLNGVNPRKYFPDLIHAILCREKAFTPLQWKEQNL